MENIKKEIKGKNFEISNILCDGELLTYLTYRDEYNKLISILMIAGIDYELINI